LQTKRFVSNLWTWRFLTVGAKKKNPNAVALGSLGGKQRVANMTPTELSEAGRKAGLARSKKLSAAERKRIAMLGVKARFGKAKAKKGEK
jgi:hypothetical protein